VFEGSVIKLESLTKLYGSHRGVTDLNLDVRFGEVFGYLGPNGAGKTTTIRLLFDLIRPTKGRAEVLGLDSHSDSREIRRRTGYLPGDLTLYENLTGSELIRHFSALRKGISPIILKHLTDRFECNLSQPIRSLSHGNKQKLGLVQAFMHEPELVVLDEPTSGLDPLVQNEFYLLLDESKSQGKTVFLSSHILPEVERVCDRVGVIRDGKLVALEEITALKQRAVHRLEIRFAHSISPDLFEMLDGVQSLSVEGPVLRCNVIGTLDSLIKTAAQFEVVDIISQEPNLEEIFLDFYSEGHVNVA